jgi:hypothetical protein
MMDAEAPAPGDDQPTAGHQGSSTGTPERAEDGRRRNTGRAERDRSASGIGLRAQSDGLDHGPRRARARLLGHAALHLPLSDPDQPPSRVTIRYVTS